ncbi:MULTISPECIES: metallophosphoesterase [unclassified Shinella]|uniref:metallophosphoesterase n=1 Tax=unclassified Shinella TaxID=2643062 RepID=UPI00102D4291|nr:MULTISPECIES: metallophosphoesterase [unclassified Shinella]MCO5148781.1 metallophosphoesterase [Shinella sp.]MDC7264842.1 metallophosphoesterase [Shinella sp. HY16]MDC7271739.1 metallophosphoesterase [Shinella sp. YZ44]MDG4673445.1 metallophosphoesterase [Shinella sp. 838]TAA52085.1 serine/threonine protein phosphatase [Shinella sp. JR1-6]
MLIAHISDFHVFSDKPETPLVRLDAERVARRVVADLAAFAPRLDAIALTGDLTDGGSAQDYALLQDILAPLSMPVFVVPGNHDRRYALRAAFADRLPFSDSSYLNYETRIGGLKVLALDTLIEGRGDGALVPESLVWLAERLPAGGTEPALVLLHHPPFPSGIQSLDKAALTAGRSEIARLVREYRGPLTILAGHIHRPFQATWNGAHCAVAGSPAFQMALYLTPTPHEPSLVSEPYAYYVYRFEDGNVAVHTRYVYLDD